MERRAALSRPAAARILLTHTALVALTPLIPVPFVDDLVERQLRRRMVRALAASHHLRIWDEEVASLSDRASRKLLGRALLGAALSPLKRLLRKTFIVLVGKRVADVASACYHRGWLIELAFARGWCAPHGPHSAREVRAAIDEVLRAAPLATSPVTQALRLGLERSQQGLGKVLRPLRERMAALRRQPVEADVVVVADEMEGEVHDAGIIEQLRRALDEVPAEHFETLERALADKLAVDDADG